MWLSSHEFWWHPWNIYQGPPDWFDDDDEDNDIVVVDILNDDIVHDDVVNDDDVNDDDAEEGRVHHRFFESMIFFSRNLVKVFYKIKNAAILK